MNFNGWGPPEFIVLALLIIILNLSWVAVFIWWISQHLTIGWMP